MWLTFRNDNGIDEDMLFGNEIIWDYKKNYCYEEVVLDKINLLLNKDLDKKYKNYDFLFNIRSICICLSTYKKI